RFGRGLLRGASRRPGDWLLRAVRPGSGDAAHKEEQRDAQEQHDERSPLRLLQLRVDTGERCKRLGVTPDEDEELADCVEGQIGDKEIARLDARETVAQWEEQ